MNGRNMLRFPGEPLDDRDETDPEWTVNEELAAQAAETADSDPAY